MQETSKQDNRDNNELHHIFVAYSNALNGGIQEVTLKNGKSYGVKIPSNLSEGVALRMPKTGTDGENTVLILHTLFDNEKDIKALVSQHINSLDLKLESKQRCMAAYNLVRESNFVEDVTALELLDFIIDNWLNDASIKERYIIASQNSRLLKLEELLEDNIASSNFSEEWQNILRGTYQTIRAGDFINSFEAIEHLDFFVLSFPVADSIKQFYLRASIAARAITSDFLINQLIYESFPAEAKRLPYLTIYNQMRDGEKVVKTIETSVLEEIVMRSSLPEECKVIYKLIQEPLSDSDNSDETVVKVKKLIKSVKKASNAVPQANTVFGMMGVKAGTGAAISGLSGAAATNATLAALGGGSVAAGGLGMLGGLAVATGGAALLGAAALVCIASTSQMNGEDQLNLGVAAGAGVAASAATIATAWAAVSTFGVAGTGTAIGSLTGAAATSATIAALGGVGFITGGAALIAVGSGYVVWKFLTSDKSDPQKMLKQLEERLYS